MSVEQIFYLGIKRPLILIEVAELLRWGDDEIAIMKRSILKDGLIPATRSSAMVWRGFMKMMNLLADPSILTEPEISAEIMKVWADRVKGFQSHLWDLHEKR